MFDLSKLKIEVQCPECEFVNKVTLGDVEKQKVIICTGCLKEIKLEQKEKSVTKARKQVNDSINDLLKAFKNL